MRKKMIHVAYFLLSSWVLLGNSGVQAEIKYETYLESWDSEWLKAMTGLPAEPYGGGAYLNTTLNISFAAFYFGKTPPGGNGTIVQGTQFLNPTSDIATIIDYVHSENGKVKLAYGGASYAYPYYPNYFISQTTEAGGWPNNIDYLANSVINAIKYNYGTGANPLYLDGVDFDIEDPKPETINGQPYSSQQFADDLYLFLEKVRAGLPNKAISLTIPGQGWGTYWEILAKLTGKPQSPVDSVNFMEYDIYISQGYSYEGQIYGDLLTYTSSSSVSPPPNWIPGWGMDPAKIQLGLMPANDDINNNLTLPAAKSLAASATSNDFGSPLYGVMTWSLNRDALTDLNPNTANNPTKLGPPAYQYTNGIRQTIYTPGDLSEIAKQRFNDLGPAPFPSLFIRTRIPFHGYFGPCLREYGCHLPKRRTKPDTRKSPCSSSSSSSS